MHYVVFCADSENGESLRKEHLEAHLAHIKTVADKLMVAGPCPPEDGERGASMLVVGRAVTAASDPLAALDAIHAAMTGP